MDKIFLNNITIETTVGVYDHEKTNLQPLVIDLEIDIDLKAASTTDNILHTIDYSKLSRWLLAHCKARKFLLIETLAEDICQNIFQYFKLANSVKIKISKIKAIKETPNVGIILQRFNPAMQ